MKQMYNTNMHNNTNDQNMSDQTMNDTNINDIDLAQNNMMEPVVQMQEITIRDALNQAIREEMRRDDNVCLMGEDVAEYEGAYKVSRGLLAEFGSRRVIDTPISEAGFSGLAIGAAYKGIRPIVEFMTWNFGMQAIDQIGNAASKIYYMSGGTIKCPIVFRGPNGPAARVAATHSQCLAATFANYSGLKIVMPSNAQNAKGLLKAAIRDDDVVLFLESEVAYGEKSLVSNSVSEKTDINPSSPSSNNATSSMHNNPSSNNMLSNHASLDSTPLLNDDIIPLGKARMVRNGNLATVITFGRMVNVVDQACAGMDIDIIDLQTIKPFDKKAIIDSVSKTHKVICIEEGLPFAGITSEMITWITQELWDMLDAKPVRLAGLDIPMPYAANLEYLACPKSAEIQTAVQKLITS